MNCSDVENFKRVSSKLLKSFMQQINALMCYNWIGKSLHVKRLLEKVAAKFSNKLCYSSTIRLLEKEVDVDEAIAILMQSHEKETVNIVPHFVHIDITPAVSILQIGDARKKVIIMLQNLIRVKTHMIICPKKKAQTQRRILKVYLLLQVIK